MKTGDLLSLSEQELVDCSKNGGNAGCRGGEMVPGFEYVMSNGISLEKDYPYEGKDLQCRRGDRKSAISIKSYVRIPQTEDDLEAAVATVGPISIAIDASYWHLYQEGIYTDTQCGQDEESLNHGVLAVGYDTENGVDYWIIKNSWGTTWGEKGYMRAAKNVNLCGLRDDTSYPVA